MIEILIVIVILSEIYFRIILIGEKPVGLKEQYSVFEL